MWQKVILLFGMFLIGFGTAQVLRLLPIPKQFKNIVIVPIVVPSISPVLAISSSLTETAFVSRVIDGDTIELSDKRKVRYIGINTPETVDPGKPVECFVKEASQENKRLVEGKTVRLEKDISQTDTYGRLLRYVYVGDVFVNDTLVRQGFAHASTFPPDVKYAQQFRLAEQEARSNNRGLWAGCPLDNSINPTNNPIRPINETITPGASSTSLTGCVIKGNISSSGKIYHLSGCGSYDKTVIDESVGEQWFCTEDEAVKAGWRKAKNCP